MPRAITPETTQIPQKFIDPTTQELMTFPVSLTCSTDKHVVDITTLMRKLPEQEQFFFGEQFSEAEFNFKCPVCALRGDHSEVKSFKKDVLTAIKIVDFIKAQEPTLSCYKVSEGAFRKHYDQLYGFIANYEEGPLRALFIKSCCDQFFHFVEVAQQENPAEVLSVIIKLKDLTRFLPPKDKKKYETNFLQEERRFREKERTAAGRIEEARSISMIAARVERRIAALRA